MHVSHWARRALVTLIVLGGSYALGTTAAQAATAAAPLPTLPTTLLTGPTSADGGGLPGTDVPVNICGNGIAVLDQATGTCTTPALPTTPATPAAVPRVSAEVPVTVCGNSVSVLGAGTGTCPAPRTPAPAGGSVVAAAVPVTVCGNSVGILGSGSGRCAAPAAPQRAGSSGHATVVVDAHTPVNACGNGIALLGHAQSGCGTSPAGSAGPARAGDGAVSADAGLSLLACGNHVALLGSGAATCAPADAVDAVPGAYSTNPEPGSMSSNVGPVASPSAESVTHRDVTNGVDRESGSSSTRPAGRQASEAGLALTGVGDVLFRLALAGLLLASGMALISLRRREARGDASEQHELR